MSPQLIQIIIGVSGTAIGAIIVGLFNFKKNNGDVYHLLISDLNSDRSALRKDIAEYREEVAGLRREIQDLRTDVKKLTGEVELHQDGRQEAEAAAAKAIEREAYWKDKYEVEHDIVNALSLFYNAKIEGREPDTSMLAVIEQKLKNAGL